MLIIAGIGLYHLNKLWSAKVNTLAKRFGKLKEEGLRAEASLKSRESVLDEGLGSVRNGSVFETCLYEYQADGQIYSKVLKNVKTKDSQPLPESMTVYYFAGKPEKGLSEFEMEKSVASGSSMGCLACLFVMAGLVFLVGLFFL